MNKINVILDCDPGHDDAMAILLAGYAPNINLLGITVIAGNQTIQKTSLNAANVASFLNIKAPIAIGEKNPLVRDRIICEEIHGESGLDGFIFPKYEHHFEKENAYQFIIKECLKHDKVTLVATGPLTNIALAIKAEPEIIPHIEEIVFMGGSLTNGNISPAAEFNILCDPEAAHIVLTHGIKTRMIGLNITRQVLVTPQIIKRMEMINNKASDMFTKLMEVFNANQKKTFGIEAAPLHDPVTIACLIDESLLTYQGMNVEIDLSHGPSYGRTNCDVFSYLKKEANCRVAIDINVNKFWDILEKGIKYYG